MANLIALSPCHHRESVIRSDAPQLSVCTPALGSRCLCTPLCLVVCLGLPVPPSVSGVLYIPLILFLARCCSFGVVPPWQHRLLSFLLFGALGYADIASSDHNSIGKKKKYFFIYTSEALE